jgi:lipopolysaccharide heptosyltransferase II
MCRKQRSVLIVLIAGIGDLVLASKSIRAIRNGFPDSSIHILVNSEASTIAENYHYVDHVWSFPVREFRKSKFQIFSILERVHEMMKMEFRTAVNLYRVVSWAGAIKMGLLFSLLKAQEKIGHSHKGFGLFMDKKVPGGTFQNRHFADAMMDIAILAGGIPDDKGIEVFWNKISEKKWHLLFSEKTAGFHKKHVAVNPGADGKHRRWKPLNFASVADHLSETYKSKIIILGGPGEENIAKDIESRMRNDAINLAGSLTLNDLVYIISRLDLLITNDSGPMHIAAAVGTPLVAIFGPELPVHAGPYVSEDLYRIVQRDVDCRPCSRRDCDRRICLDSITPEEVIEKCSDILGMG